LCDPGGNAGVVFAALAEEHGPKPTRFCALTLNVYVDDTPNPLT
jgi:hypothetical protein